MTFKYPMKAHKYIAEHIGGPDKIQELFSSKLSELDSLIAIEHFIVAGSTYTIEDLDDLEIHEVFGMFQDAMIAWVDSKTGGKKQEEKATNPPRAKKTRRKKIGPN